MSALVLLVSACGDDVSEATKTPAASATVPVTQYRETAGGGASPTDTGEAAPTGTGSSIDACALLTTDEASEVVGQIDPPKHDVVGDSDVCTYNSKDVVGGFIILTTRSGVSRDQFETEKSTAGTLLNQDVMSVDGIGDSAFYIMGLFYAHKGNVELDIVSFTSLDTTDPSQNARELETDKNLAQKAIARLP